MILRKLAVLIAFFVLSSVSLGEPAEYEKGDKIKTDPWLLRPTQFLFSQLEVDFRIKQLKALMTEDGKDAVVEFLKDHRGQVVVGPNKQLWLVDGHHRARALESLIKTDSRFKELPFYAKVIREWDELSPTEFEKAMKLGNKHGQVGEAPYVYLKDANGKTQSFKKLPKRLSSLKDFPYRGLAWMLKNEGLIEENEEIPFQEFLVAEYLQKHIKLPAKMTPKAYKKAFQEAVRLIEESEEGDFPGYKKLSKSACARILRQIQ